MLPGRNILPVVMAVLWLAGAAVAGDAGRESPFAVGVSARSLAMGGGFTSLADDAAAIFYNPAGLAALQYQEVSLSRMLLLEGATSDYAGWAYPLLNQGGVGLAYMRVGVDDITRRSDFVKTGSFDYGTWQLLLSYGRRLRGGLAMGVGIKVVNQKLDVYSDYGAGLDFGMTADLGRQLVAGIMIRDMISPSLKLEGTNEITPLTVTGGLGIKQLRLSNRIDLSGSFELEKIEKRATRVHAGAEVSFDECYSLRAGYNRDNISFGAGLKHQRLKIDYAYKVLGYVNDSHRFSLSFLIGSSLDERRDRRQQEAQRRGSELLADERHRQFMFYRDKADAFYRQFQLDSALTYYQRALAHDEGNREIIGTIAGIENARRILLQREQMMVETQRESNRDAENYLRQARSFFSKHYYAAALDMLQLVLDIEPEHKSARTLKDAIEDTVKSVITQNLEIGQAAERNGQYLTAIESYSRILELDSSHVEALRARQRTARNLDLAQQLNRAMELYREGEYVRSRRYFQAVLTTDPSEPIATEYLRKIDQALAQSPVLEEIQKDKTVWPLYLDGLRHMRNKEYQKAIEAWEKVLQAYPNSTSTRDNLEQARLRLQSQKSE